MSCSVKTYSVPYPTELSDDYSITVNRNEICVYNARVSAMPYNQSWPAYQRPLDQTELASFAFWDMDGPGEIEITPSKPIESVTIRPLTQNVKYTVKDNKLSFVISGPSFWVK